MALKILGVVVLVLAGFLAYVSTRNGNFRYEKSALIKASPEAIYPYLSDLEKGNEWSPYTRKDPNMKKTIKGDGKSVGSSFEFDGNSDVGAGVIEIKELNPNHSVKLKLTMLKPFKAENDVEYVLVPEADGTRFSWIMSGDGGFLSKLITLLIDCEKMVTADWGKGFENLKQIVETPAAKN